MLKQITVNKYQLLVADEDHIAAQEFLDKKSLLHLGDYFGGANGLYISKMSRERLYQLSGLDMSKVDFAYPNGFANNGRDLVWYYGENKTFGSPVYDEAVLRALAVEIVSKL